MSYATGGVRFGACTASLKRSTDSFDLSRLEWPPEAIRIGNDAACSRLRPAERPGDRIGPLSARYIAGDGLAGSSGRPPDSHDVIAYLERDAVCAAEFCIAANERFIVARAASTERARRFKKSCRLPLDHSVVRGEIDAGRLFEL